MRAVLEARTSAGYNSGNNVNVYRTEQESCLCCRVFLLFPFSPSGPLNAVDDSYTQSADGLPVDVFFPGILANDSVPCGSDAILSVVTVPKYGLLTSFTNDGSFSYTPATPPRDDSFVYEIECPGGITSRATVRLPAPPGVFYSVCGLRQQY